MTKKFHIKVWFFNACFCGQKLIHIYDVSDILSGIIEAQKQLQSGNSDIAFDYPLEVRDSFVALVSAFYNFSRHKPMQIEIGIYTLF